MKRLLFGLLLLILPARAVELLPAPAPADNPLKGFMPYDGVYDFPHSLEWFYLPLKDLQSDFDKFNWQPLDAKLNAISGRGHQAVFRVYLDYPNTSYGVPEFLREVNKRAYDSYGNGKTPQTTSFSPDYENPQLRRALQSFIAALGKRYDGDARVGFITVGLLGFWGEWHTYPHQNEQENWMASAAVQNEVLDAFAKGFHKTKLLLREPKPDIDVQKRALGFHDDSFAYQTLAPDDWHFWPKIQAAKLTEIWKTQPIGGEVRPEVQDCIWNETNENCVPTGQEFDRCVNTTHASWMLNQGVFKELSDAQKTRALAGARSLGYEFWVRSANVAARKNQVQLEIAIVNRGVAPFYYDWPLEIALLDKNKTIVQRFTTDWKLSSVLPDAPQTWKFVAPIQAPRGDYRVLMRVVNPLSNGKALRFANQSQDADVDGWLSLGNWQH